MKKISLLVLLIIGLIPQAKSQFFDAPFQPQQAEYVGISSASLEYVASFQKRQMWCWAACIEMVMRYYGLNVTQEEIASRTFGTDWYGNPPPFGATISDITKNLNNWGIDRNGHRYRVSARVSHSLIKDALFLKELSYQKPMIIAYGPNLHSGHVVVLTAASYITTPQGPRIRTLVVRDPFPNAYTIHTNGRVEYLNYPSPQQGGLPAPVQAVWFIDVNKE